MVREPPPTAYCQGLACPPASKQGESRAANVTMETYPWCAWHAHTRCDQRLTEPRTSSCPRALIGANSEGENIRPSPRRRDERGPSLPNASVSCGGRFRFLLPLLASSPIVRPVADSSICAWICALLTCPAVLRGFTGCLWCDGRNTDVVPSFVNGATSEFCNDHSCQCIRQTGLVKRGERAVCIISFTAELVCRQ